MDVHLWLLTNIAFQRTWGCYLSRHNPDWQSKSNTSKSESQVNNSLKRNFRVNPMDSTSYDNTETLTESARTPRKPRSYTDAEKAKALIALDLNNGNVKFTAEQIGIPRITLNQWKNEQYINSDVIALRHNKTKELADRFEDLANLYIGQAVLTVDSAKGTNAITGAGIAVDKMRLLRGESTQNIAIHSIAEHTQRKLNIAIKLHKADPENEPLPSKELAIELYKSACQNANLEADLSLLDLDGLPD